MGNRSAGLGMVPVGVLVAAACADGGSRRPADSGRDRAGGHGGRAVDDHDRTRRPPSPVPLVEPSPRELGPEALIPSEMPDVPTEIRFTDPAFGPPLVESGDLKPGGPAPDGIPSIDEPRFDQHRPTSTSWSDQEPVLRARAGRRGPGLPAADPDVARDRQRHRRRRPRGGHLLPAVQLRLRPRPSPRGPGARVRRVRCAVEQLTGHVRPPDVLVVVPLHRPGARSACSPATSSAASPSPSRRGPSSRAAHPDGIVLSRDTGFTKDYGRNPYPGYDDVERPAVPLRRRGRRPLRGQDPHRRARPARRPAGRHQRSPRSATASWPSPTATGRWWCGGSRAPARRSTPAPSPAAGTSAPPARSRPPSTARR